MLQTDTARERALDLYQRFMRALHAARMRRGISPWADCSLSLHQLRALSLIAAREQAGLSSRELALQLGVGPSAITPLVDRLVERELVTRREDPRDRRITRLSVTPS